MRQYKIIWLDPKDHHKCSNIWNMARDPEQTRKWHNELKLGTRITWVYTEDGEFLGECSLVTRSDDPEYTVAGQRVYLSRLIVKDTRRSQGIGGLLTDFIIEQAKDLGYREISIGVDKDNGTALRLYQKKGFTEVLFDGEDEDGPYYKLLKRLEE